MGEPGGLAAWTDPAKAICFDDGPMGSWVDGWAGTACDSADGLPGVEDE